MHALNAYSYRKLELGEAVRGMSEELLAGALADQHFARTELPAVLAQAGIVAAGLRLGYVLISAELNGLICSGPRRCKHHTYALLDERAPLVPSASAVDRDEALGRLARRYFSGHGPATVKDCTYWSSLSVEDIKRGLEIAAAQLRRETVEAVQYWTASSKYVIGVSGAARSQPPEQGVFNHVLVIDGQVAGRWRRTQRSKSVLIEVAPHARLDTKAIRALHDAVTRHGHFLGLPATVVTVVTSR